MLTTAVQDQAEKTKYQSIKRKSVIQNASGNQSEGQTRDITMVANLKCKYRKSGQSKSKYFRDQKNVVKKTGWDQN